jgi:hypothetical protein
MRAAAANRPVDPMNIVLQNLADLSEIERRIAFGLRTCEDQRNRMASLEAGGRDAADERALLEATEELITLMKAYRSALVERLLADGYVPASRGQKH